MSTILTTPPPAAPASPERLPSPSSSSGWLARYRNGPGPTRHTLVAFPWSGAGPTAYNSWIPLLPQEIDLVTVALPGRDDRRDEDPVTKLTPGLVDAITDALLAHTGDGDGTVALFGHSFGALLAHAVAVRMQEHQRTPQAVIVSGSRAPMVRPPHPLHLLGERELLAKLIDMGGLPPRLQRHEQFLRSWLPRVRADLTACETYWPGTLPVLDCPLFAWSGAADWYAPACTTHRWLELAPDATHTTFPGGHFFISGQRGTTALLQALQWPRPVAARPLRLLQSQPLLARRWGA
ncbi:MULTISPECIES: thioesterase II family protein [Lentzea]|uniref:Surfactin synthase thioesterase subunit n=2 Tax=Lentzea TaxID=165301 RepID=A0A1W2DCF9_9PSEU|nr:MULTISPECIES: alpha/beta fold hydrolase [Lentzea]MDX8140540.1 thioesterase domain-containing protein [Lentzea sp. BCCO 10_0061]SMC95229.1 Surfactin synthase thioesterase subunit [Lentzea albidocapillata]